MAVIPLGVAGAAYATAAGYVLQSVIGVIFFFANRNGTLYFVRPKFDGKALLKACSNGMSEMVGMLAVTVTMIAMNIILMSMVGADGVAAATIILFAQTILSAVYAGYIQGIGPIISYHYGAENYAELGTLYRVALKMIGVMSSINLCRCFSLRQSRSHWYLRMGRKRFYKWLLGECLFLRRHFCLWALTFLPPAFLLRLATEKPPQFFRCSVRWYS